MANFHVHEDFSCIVENIQSKIGKKGCQKTHRAVLQPLCGYQQNCKRPKGGAGKENSSVVTSKIELNVHKSPPSDVICLKPILKKPKFRVSAPQFVDTEYDEEIWEYLNMLEKKLHRVKPCYMTKQLHLNWGMRSMLVDWLVSVADEYQMSNESIHLGVNYLDRFLSNISVIREKFQLVGATAMLLAGKIEEVYPIDTKEWAYLTGNTFTVRQIIKMEQLMLRILNFNVHAPTTLDFIKHLCAKHKIDNKTMYLAMYLSELMLLEGDTYLQHFPSKLAAACLVFARHTLYKPEVWSRKLEATSGYTLKQLSPVVKKQKETFNSSPFKEQQAIQKKYASDKYQRVALLKPRVLVLDEEE